ncbi:CRISPR-associated protein Cas1 [Pullulanibacillus pueri]|uniref:CRISPR-associated endonuclease Cas1 n=1 Tax=Pullulanibacillus pueri TaxID=1437324 RepID=A0A8J3EJQ3_9BACL|nr:CRISPR-associated endonuclease Cas1 [Pullulanibacillus pueri]MBM7679885.1 CRISPR-associated protein Cas1 [Pullulanibacillus pueri]GGH73312.1 CRISPR-associated exonuclease Cas4/endonuclease Cas1 fusion [Pullulanibacillus pueri]
MGSIPIRMLNEVQYCERLFHLMHVQGLFEESSDTVEGSAQHLRAEKRLRRGQMAPEELWGSMPKSLRLGDEQLQIHGVLDSVNYESGKWAPVEAKHSSAPDGTQAFNFDNFTICGLAWPNDQIQLCAQGLLMRSNGYPCDYGYLFYRGNKKKVKIEFTPELIKATELCIAKARKLNAHPEIVPKPLTDSKKCFRCSLNYICLPDETNYLLGVSNNIRKIIPSRVDGGVLYVSEPGTRLGKSGDELIIQFKDGRKQGVPIKDLIHITLIGNVQCSTQLLQTLMFANVTISYLTSHGRLIGVSTPPLTKNIYTRRQQFIKFNHPEFSLQLAKKIVYAKIRNQRTLLRRNAGSKVSYALDSLTRLSEKSSEAETIDKLRGLEGMAAKIYFENFSTMFKSHLTHIDVMKGRNRRPPKDPVNVLLSLGYTLMVRDFQAACGSVGFDAMLGFYHRPEAGRPALVLDMMEPFRPLIVDSIVLRALNTGELTLDNFYMGSDSCQLKKGGRNNYFALYERRMHDKITDPTFGYKISYRRMIELHLRMLARFIEGEIKEYIPLMTR